MTEHASQPTEAKRMAEVLRQQFSRPSLNPSKTCPETGRRCLCPVFCTRDGRGSEPWGAYHTPGLTEPDSWHPTMREAQLACEEAINRVR